MISWGNTFYDLLFYGIICSILTFGIWRDINYFSVRSRLKRIEKRVEELETGKTSE